MERVGRSRDVPNQQPGAGIGIGATVYRVGPVGLAVADAHNTILIELQFGRDVLRMDGAPLSPLRAGPVANVARCTPVKRTVRAE